MNTKRVLGFFLMLAAGLTIYIFEDTSGGIGFLSGMVMAIGLGFLIGWLPLNKKGKIK